METLAAAHSTPARRNRSRAIPETAPAFARRHTTAASP